jgi:CPA1 family monovalent cation:H+ antiporter
MNDVVVDALTLLVVAIPVALITRRFAFPYTVGLVVTGIGLALTGRGSNAVLTRELIYNVILPPLLFEAAINLHWRELRRDALPILTLALPGTFIAAAVVTAGMMLVLHWPLVSALSFGILIAATDPVAVIAMFKDRGMTGRIRLLVESESLFNDGVAAVLFAVMLDWIEAGGQHEVPFGQVARVLILTVPGGVVIGVACALGVVAIAGRTTDHLVESALTTVAAYGSFLLAEHFHCSGVLATVAAGLVVGNLAVLPNGEANRITRRGQAFVLDVWEFIAFLTNSVVFLLIGLALGDLRIRLLGTRSLLAIIALVLVARAVSVYPLSLLFARSYWAIPMRAQHVLWWGGLRGALGLALALSVPQSVPFRDEILVATFGVVAFSVIFQGLTIPVLLRRLPTERTEAARDLSRAAKDQ